MSHNCIMVNRQKTQKLKKRKTKTTKTTKKTNKITVKKSHLKLKDKKHNINTSKMNTNRTAIMELIITNTNIDELNHLQEYTALQILTCDSVDIHLLPILPPKFTRALLLE